MSIITEYMKDRDFPPACIRESIINDYAYDLIVDCQDWDDEFTVPMTGWLEFMDDMNKFIVKLDKEIENEQNN